MNLIVKTVKNETQKDVVVSVITLVTPELKQIGMPRVNVPAGILQGTIPVSLIGTINAGDIVTITVTPATTK